MNKPSVILMDFTGRGTNDPWYAANALIFTKSTRLNLSTDLAEKIHLMTDDQRSAELEYMAGTIPSSWEFVDLAFLVSNVSRPCAQQITRTRTGSYAMQSQRVTDISAAEVSNPFDEGFMNSDELLCCDIFEAAVDSARISYTSLIENGATQGDARGVMPLNTTTNICCKYNLRSFVELVQARRSLRTQSEYAKIVDEMYRLVLDVWPWSTPFFKAKHEAAIEMLEAVVDDLGLEVGSGPGWTIAKAIDLIRKAS